jgi:hypothetical protein
MRRTVFLTAALALVTAAFARAQATTTAQPSVILIQPATFNGCPVGFYAGHSNSLTQLRAQDVRPGVISQSLNVRMSNSTHHDIVSAQITVHGLSPLHRITPAGADAVNGDLTKQVQLELSVDAGKQSATDLRVYGFTSIRRIDLDSLTYADGTTWTASAQHRCSVTPNGMMLVAAAQ